MSKRTKTKPDNTLMVARDYPAVAPIIEREFNRICPTLTLLDFGAGQGPHRWFHWIILSGTETELLRLGIVDSSMIAVRPKRVAYHRRISSRRLAGDRVRVRMDLGADLDLAHLLAPLASWNWHELVEQSEGAPEAAHVLSQSHRSANSIFWALGKASASLSDECFRWSDVDIEQLAAVLGKFVDNKRITDRGPRRHRSRSAPHLRLVVDNEVRP